jgi:hypothetical protein
MAEGLEEARESESSPASSVVAKKHGTSMAVWNVPTPIEYGARFNPRIGVRCDDGCVLSGATVEVLDDTGKKVATGTLSPDPWGGTSDLYWAEVELRAPVDGGYHGWSARFPQTTVASFQHDEASQAFGLSTTKPPECTVTVGVTDEDTREPVDSAYVRLGLHSGYTDESGLVKVALPKDSYEFVVWKTKHKMHRTTVVIAKDEDLRVELTGCKVCRGLA